MKYTALTLIVIGVATVNAGTVVSSSSSSGANQNSGLVGKQGAVFSELASGQAQNVANKGGMASGGAQLQGWNADKQRNSNWQAQCDEDNLEECHHDVRVGPAGQGVSGNAVSSRYVVGAGQQVIPAQIIHSGYVLNATNTSSASSNNTVSANQEENWNVTGTFTNQRYEVYQSCQENQDNFTV